MTGWIVWNGQFRMDSLEWAFYYVMDGLTRPPRAVLRIDSLDFLLLFIVNLSNYDPRPCSNSFP